jgi:chromatin assembly factor 1 subunit B
MAKVIKGNQQIRMTNAFGAATAAAAESTLPTFTTATEDVSTIKTPATANHLYADSTVPCFFRRPSFTPDGSLLITPAGIHRPVSSATLGNDTSMLGSSFCTHVFLRDHLQTPIVSLVGLEDPSVAVRCSPILYKLVEHGGEEAKQNSLFSGDYR